MQSGVSCARSYNVMWQFSRLRFKYFIGQEMEIAKACLKSLSIFKTIFFVCQNKVNTSSLFGFKAGSFSNHTAKIIAINKDKRV